MVGRLICWLRASTRPVRRAYLFGLPVIGAGNGVEVDAFQGGWWAVGVGPAGGPNVKHRGQRSERSSVFRWGSVESESHCGHLSGLVGVGWWMWGSGPWWSVGRPAERPVGPRSRPGWYSDMRLF